MRLKEKVNELVKERLHALRLNQRVLARKLGISDSTMTRKLNGESSFNDREMKVLSDFLQIPDLFDYPIRPTDMSAVCSPYAPGVRVVNEAIPLLSLRQQSELYLLCAIYLEPRLPSTTYADILREIAAALS